MSEALHRKWTKDMNYDEMIVLAEARCEALRCGF
jgi:hypothetical protein